MALQISEFTGTATNARGDAVTVLEGPPLVVTPLGFTGTYTVGPRGRILRIKGAGYIAWGSQPLAEAFDGTEYRTVRPGDVLTVVGNTAPAFGQLDFSKPKNSALS